MRETGGIVEQRSWYSTGYCAVEKQCGLCKGIWLQLPYRRFTVPWRDGRVATPWVRREGVGDLTPHKP
jgi:hypothetical protein